jgi:SOS-response transcriptional repressor LexA
MKENNCNVSEVFARLKSALDLPTDAALAELFKVPIRRLQTWRSRNTIPTCNIIALCQEKKLDLNYVWGLKSSEHKLSTTHTTPPSKINNMVSDQIVNFIQMDNQWLRHSLNVAPERMALIQVKANNMIPWVVDGDLVIINKDNTTIINDAPYVIQVGDVLLVKRLVDKHDGTIIAKSDSQYCDDEVFTAEAPPVIVGRIIRRITR